MPVLLVFLNPEIDEMLTLDRLQSGPLASLNWATPASGIQIKQGIDDLERLWGELVGLYGGVQVGVEDVGALEGELRMALCRHRAREWWLRDEKIAQTRAAHDGRLPCEVCGFDFFEVYGEIGRDYAQVHHLKPLGDHEAQHDPARRACRGLRQLSRHGAPGRSGASIR